MYSQFSSWWSFSPSFHIYIYIYICFCVYTISINVYPFTLILLILLLLLFIYVFFCLFIYTFFTFYTFYTFVVPNIAWVASPNNVTVSYVFCLCVHNIRRAFQVGPLRWVLGYAWFYDIAHSSIVIISPVYSVIPNVYS